MYFPLIYRQIETLFVDNMYISAEKENISASQLRILYELKESTRVGVLKLKPNYATL